MYITSHRLSNTFVFVVCGKTYKQIYIYNELRLQKLSKRFFFFLRKPAIARDTQEWICCAHWKSWGMLRLRTRRSAYTLITVRAPSFINYQRRDRLKHILGFKDLISARFVASLLTAASPTNVTFLRKARLGRDTWHYPWRRVRKRNIPQILPYYL